MEHLCMGNIIVFDWMPHCMLRSRRPWQEQQEIEMVEAHPIWIQPKLIHPEAVRRHVMWIRIYMPLIAVPSYYSIGHKLKTLSCGALRSDTGPLQSSFGSLPLHLPFCQSSGLLLSGWTTKLQSSGLPTDTAAATTCTRATHLLNLLLQ
jgi:hypothetical protein